MNTKNLSNKLFTEFLESVSIGQNRESIINTEGIITSVDEFVSLLIKANEIYSTTNNIPNSDQLVFSEDVPHDIVSSINNQTDVSSITQNTLRDLRIVTYTVEEKPAIISSRKPTDQDGIRSVKWRLIDTFQDPEYSGYSIARTGKEFEAEVTFRIWGINFYDIRKRSRLLRDAIDSNVWFFKHKGLRDIIWLDGLETRLWDGKSIVKERTERYLIRFAQIRSTREKNLEQMIIQFGVEEK